MAPSSATMLLLCVCLLALGAAPAQAQFTKYTTLAQESGDTLLQANTSTQFVLKTTFQPCTGFQIHTHPRGSELILVHTGQLYAGYVTEEAQLVASQIGPDGLFLVPQGLVHFVLNRDCRPSAASFVFPPNPGLQFQLQAASAIPGDTLSYFAAGPLPKAKGKIYTTVDQACMKRCGALGSGTPAGPAPSARAAPAPSTNGYTPTTTG